MSKNKKINPIKQMRNTLEDILLPGEVIYPTKQDTQLGHEIQSYYWISNYSRLISSYGNIWRVIKSFDNSGGYQHVILRSTNGGNVNALNHRLLLAAITDDMDYFHKSEADHLSGNKSDNTSNNLELVDHRLNVTRAYANGQKKSITDDQIIEIIQRCQEAFPNNIDSILAEEYGVKENTIKYIRLGRDKYKERLERLGLKPVKKKEFSISDEQIINIMKDVNYAFPVNIDDELAIKYNVSRYTILDIRTGNGIYLERLKRFGLSPIIYQRGLSDWHINKIFELVNEGKSDEEIAKELNIAKNTVTMVRTGNGTYADRLASMGISSQSKKITKISEDKIRYIMEKSIEAYPNKIDKELAIELDVSEYTIMHIRSGLYEYKDLIKNLGFSPILYSNKTTNKITDEIICEVIKLANEGYSDKEIAKKVGRAETTIKNIRTGNISYIDRIKALKLKPVLK